MIRSIIESNLRHLITLAGAWMASQGYTYELDQQLIGGLAVAGAGLILGLVDKLKNLKNRTDFNR